MADIEAWPAGSRGHELFRQKIVSAAIAMVIAAFAVSDAALAQRGPEAMIGIFGRVIEEGMRQQQQQEMQRRQQQQEELERQRILAEQERERRFQREAEIAWTRQVQRALWKLGFYEARVDGDWGPLTRGAATRFNQAFGLPDGDYSPEWVDFLEEMAERGFRSTEEYEAARDGGFSTRAQLIDARERGFSTAAELAAAEADGFRTNAEHEQFRASGLPDRETFLAHRKERARIAERADNCRALAAEGQWLNAAGACHVAMTAGAEDAGVADTYRNVHREIGTIITMTDEDIAALQGSIDNLREEPEQGSRDDPPDIILLEDLDALTAYRADLAHADAVFRCWSDSLDARWPDALAACEQAAASAGDDAVIVMWLAQAQAQVEELEQRRREEERLRAERAEEERRRLALANARDSAEELLNALQAYAESGARFDNGLEIARNTVALREALGHDEAERIEEARLRLDSLLEEEDRYRTFLAQRREAERVAQTRALVTARRNVERLGRYIEDYISANVLSPHVATLLEVQDGLSQLSDSSSRDDVILAQREVMETLEGLGLADGARSHLARFSDEEDEDEAIEKSSAGFIITDRNRDLLTGDDRDILILMNQTGSAPHLARSITGDLVFDGRKARLCWFHNAPTRTAPVRMALNIARAAGADRLDDEGRCAADDVDGHDLILLRRGAFATTDPAYAELLVHRFEASDIRLLDMVSWAEIGEREEEMTAFAAEIRQEVAAGLREGYGIIAPRRGSNQLCLVVPEDATVHREVLARSHNQLSLLIDDGLSLSEASLEATFVDIQRGNCAAVYAGHGDLAALLSALERDGMAHDVVPWWAPPDEVASVRHELETALAARDREIGSRQQALEGERRLEQERRAAQQAEMRERQAELRQRYGQEARGALNQIRAIAADHLEAVKAQASGRTMADEDQASGRTMADEYLSEFARHARELVDDLWEVGDHRVEMVDYGSASWEQRRVGTVIGRVEIEWRNRPLGRYHTDCFLITLMIDAEFDIFRDTLAVECGTGAEDLEGWKRSRGFESRWRVAG